MLSVIDTNTGKSIPCGDFDDARKVRARMARRGGSWEVVQTNCARQQYILDRDTGEIVASY